ncbi:MAG: TssN family type VI secretion system protein [Ferruginibacter sp.]
MEIGPAEYEERHKMIVTVKESWTIVQAVVKAFVYSLVCIVTALLLAYLSTTEIGIDLSAYEKKLFYLTAMLLVGVSHIFSFPKWLPHLNDRHRKTGLLYSISLAALIGISTGLLFSFLGFERLQLPLAGTCSFLFPTAILQSWIYFDSISPKAYPNWYLPVAMPSNKMTAVLLNSLQIKFRLKLNYSDTAENLFVSTVPANSQLGKIFQFFLTDIEEAGTKIQLLDEQHQPYGWRFLHRKTLVTVVLDPESTPSENKIKPHDTILIERIKIN